MRNNTLSRPTLFLLLRRQTFNFASNNWRTSPRPPCFPNTVIRTHSSVSCPRFEYENRRGIRRAVYTGLELPGLPRPGLRVFGTATTGWTIVEPTRCQRGRTGHVHTGRIEGRRPCRRIEMDRSGADGSRTYLRVDLSIKIQPKSGKKKKITIFAYLCTLYSFYGQTTLHDSREREPSVLCDACQRRRKLVKRKSIQLRFFRIINFNRERTELGKCRKH